MDEEKRFYEYGMGQQFNRHWLTYEQVYRLRNSGCWVIDITPQPNQQMQATGEQRDPQAEVVDPRA